jgi:opacity protein-like surface antigen
MQHRAESSLMEYFIRRSFVLAGTAVLALLTIPFAAAGSKEPKVAETNRASKPESPAKTGFYGALGIGVGLNSTIPLNNGTGSPYTDETFKTQTNVGPNVALGYAFPGAWRAEAEYLGLFTDFNDNFLLSGVGRESVPNLRTNANIFQFNLVKDIPTRSKFTPYVGLGVGFASIGFSDSIAGSTTGTTFAGQGKLGISYKISRNTSAYLGYRILGIGGGTSIDYYFDNPTTKTNIQQAMDLGFRFMF